MRTQVEYFKLRRVAETNSIAFDSQHFVLYLRVKCFRNNILTNEIVKYLQVYLLNLSVVREC